MDTRQHGNGQQVLQSIVFKFIHLAEAERDGTSGTEIGRNFGAKRATSDPFFRAARCEGETCVFCCREVFLRWFCHAIRSKGLNVWCTSMEAMPLWIDACDRRGQNRIVNSKSSARKGMWHTDTSYHKFQQSFPQALHHGSGAGLDDHYHLSGEGFEDFVKACK